METKNINSSSCNGEKDAMAASNSISCESANELLKNSDIITENNCSTEQPNNRQETCDDIFVDCEKDLNNDQLMGENSCAQSKCCDSTPEINETKLETQQTDHVEQRLSKEDKSSIKDLQTNDKSIEVNSDTQNSSNVDDPELDSLLEDALDDFDKVSTQVRNAASKVPTAVNSDPASSSSTNAVSQSGSNSNQTEEAMFNEVFNMLSNQSPDDRKALETIFKSLAIGQPNASEPATSQSDHAATVAGSSSSGFSAGSGSTGAGTGNLWESIQHTLNNLATDEQGLESDEFSEADFMKLMSTLAGEGGAGAEGAGLGGLGAMGAMFGGMEGGEEGELMPLMQGMMKNLLSRDVLYPSLKEISTQYPAWLTANKGVIDDESFTRYERQYQLMSGIVGEFETENETDSDKAKAERFQRIFDSMQSMQELGHPPKEIIGDVPQGLELDESGLPRMFSGANLGNPPGGNSSGNPDQCPVM